MATDAELLELVVDPTKSITKILSLIIDNPDANLDVVDPTNPFMFSMEATAALTAAAINKFDIGIRDVFPILGTNTDELYKHISDADIIGISSTPSTISTVFFIKKLDILQSGVAYDGYRKCSIPLYTNLTIDDIVFTLLNKIDIYIYDSGEINIEQQSSESGLGIDNVYILNNILTTDSDNVEWVVFETIIRQVKREVFTDNITSTSKFTYEAVIKDKFFYTEVFSINSDDVRTKLNIVYNDTIFDINTPSIFVKFLDGKIVYDLPMLYQMQGGIDSNIEIVLYTTKGNINIPLEIMNSQQFQLKLGPTLSYDSAVTENINKYVISRGMATFGKNGKTIDEIRESVIFNTIGKIDTPITIKEIEEYASRDDFKINLIKDTVTGRTFIANKTLPVSTNTNIKVRADLYNNTVSLKLDELSSNQNIVLTNDNAVIKSKALFKYSNGILEVLDNVSIFNINNMSKKELISYLNSNTIFYNPFYYIIEKDANIIKSKIYDLDNPYLSNLRVEATNNYIKPRANIVSMSISIGADGYIIKFKVSGNDDFNNLRPAFIKAQLSIPLNDSIEKVYFTEAMTSDSTGKYFTFNIKSTFFIDSKNGISISGGDSLVVTKSVPISEKMDIVLYSIDNMVTKDIEHSSYDNLVMIDDKENLNVLTLETVRYSIGQELTNLWNDIKNYYTNKKFKRYEYDELAKYSENIYEYCPETNSIFWPIRDVNDVIIDLEARLLHAKGDVIQDDEGNNIYAHRKGDYVLDTNGNMILDGVSGVVRAVDMLMVDYKFLVAGNDYPSYVSEYTNTIITWLNNSIKDLNDRTLEQTNIYYRPFKTAGTVKVISNNLVTAYDSIITPRVIVYLKNAVDITTELTNNYKNTIGAIIHKAVENKTFNISDIRNQILSALGSNVLGVKIDDITPDNKEVVTITDDGNVFTVDKEIVLDNNNNIDINYKINISIESNI